MRKDLVELEQAKNARDEAREELARERAAHTSLKQLIRSELALPETDNQGVNEETIVKYAASRLANYETPGMTDAELKEELQRIDESEDDCRPGWFRDNAFLQSLAGSAVAVVNGEMVEDLVNAAYEIAKQSDAIRDWSEE